MSFLEMFSQASLVVKFVMLLLFFLSFLSWKIIFSETRLINKNFKEIKDLKKEKNTNIYKKLTNYIKNKNNSMLSTIFKESLNKLNENESDFEHFRKINKWSFDNSEFKINKEIENLENKIKILATFSSVAPYIGLLGTVWGIMDAFIAIGHLKSVSLSDIAPSIAEALIATAIGLFVAIPSSIYYNKLTSRIDFLKHKYNNFNKEIYIKIEKIIIENEGKHAE
tara:strand:+ start:30805 stop:31476 length:672 start_codon:yes stop_codon:yes gene_type:complete